MVCVDVTTESCHSLHIHNASFPFRKIPKRLNSRDSRSLVGLVKYQNRVAKEVHSRSEMGLFNEYNDSFSMKKLFSSRS